MKKRMSCMLLCIMLLISLLPVAAVSAFADAHTHSPQLSEMIKGMEGFHATAEWDVSQWSIGYGTKSRQGQTITEPEASAALEAELNMLDEKINAFAAQSGRNFAQHQHDALVSLSYNCGWDWIQQPGRFKDAVLNGTWGNEFLYAISLWANINSVPSGSLINRRLAEANLYFNGIYSKDPPANFTYVILDPNGGTPGNNGEDKMQGFDTNNPTRILAANPTKAGAVFGGWYTSSVGGSAVTQLNGSVAGKTLYAQYGFEVTVTRDGSNIRSSAGVNGTQIGIKNAGEKLIIVEMTKIGDALWGRFDCGWIAMENTNYNGALVEYGKGEAVVASGIVTVDTYVNVRKAAGTGNPIVGSVSNGTRVNIHETAVVDNVQWGRIHSGWISMAYVKLDSGSGSSSGLLWNGTTGAPVVTPDNSTVTTPAAATVIATGKVNTTTNLHVRSGAGTGYSVIRYLTPGTKVNIYEKKTVNGQEWGRIDTGSWVCLTYILQDGTTPSNGGTGVLATGTVNTTTNLNVRSGAGTGYSKLRTLTPGTAVSIYERVTVNGQEWGRIDGSSWICLSYVQLNGSNSGQTNGSGKVISDTGLNIRAAAGTGNAIVGNYTRGTVVTILETTSVGNVRWGRTDRGWVCMDYIQMYSSVTNSGGSTAGLKWN